MAELDSRGPQMEAVIIAFLVTCVITVSLRCYTMIFILKRFAVEDYLAVLALGLYVTFAALALVSIRYGLGSHLEAVALQDRPIAFKFRWLATLIYILESYLVKVVVGLLLIRICSASHQKWQRVTIWSLLLFVGLFYGAYFLIAIFACQPVDYYYTRYNPIPPEGKCNSAAAATVITYIATMLNVVADWTLAILPATVIWRAMLDLRTKISISVVLGIGSIASIATLVRVFYAKTVLENPDYLYNFTDIAIWSAVEIGVALTASSLATLKPLFRQFFRMQGFSSRRPSGYGPSSSRRRNQSAGPIHGAIQVQHSFGSYSAKKLAVSGHAGRGGGHAGFTEWRQSSSHSDEIAMAPTRSTSGEWRSAADAKEVSFQNYEVEITAT
ncbi:unnamed protein product [Discula destructiva]